MLEARKREQEKRCRPRVMLTDTDKLHSWRRDSNASNAACGHRSLSGQRRRSRSNRKVREAQQERPRIDEREKEIARTTPDDGKTGGYSCVGEPLPRVAAEDDATTRCYPVPCVSIIRPSSSRCPLTYWRQAHSSSGWLLPHRSTATARRIA